MPDNLFDKLGDQSVVLQRVVKVLVAVRTAICRCKSNPADSPFADDFVQTVERAGKNEEHSAGVDHCGFIRTTPSADLELASLDQPQH